MKRKRDQIEASISIEETMLEAVVDLLNRKAAFSDWPEDVHDVFLLALLIKESRKGDREAWKAFRTARHLRLERDRLPGEPVDASSLKRRCAERVRADLPHLVQLGAGSYLTKR